MSKLFSFLKFAALNFGPAIVFYGTNHYCGLKPAIIFSTLYTGMDLAFRYWKRLPVNSLYRFSAATTLCFGAVDLYSKAPFLIRYESVATNVITGFFFFVSLFASRTVLEEMAAPQMEGREQAADIAADLGAFFRFLTVVWSGYFFAKAAVYFWVASNYSIEQAMVIRTTFGTASLYVLIFASAAGGRPFFILMRKLGLLKNVVPTAPRITASA
jgi:intracellular septation protein A